MPKAYPEGVWFELYCSKTIKKAGTPLPALCFPLTYEHIWYIYLLIYVYEYTYLSRVWVMMLSNHPIGAGRLELPRALCPTDFKSGVSTDSTMLPYVYSIRYLVMIVKWLTISLRYDILWYVHDLVEMCIRYVCISYTSRTRSRAYQSLANTNPSTNS